MEESVKKTEAAIEAILFSMGDAVELKDLAADRRKDSTEDSGRYDGALRGRGSRHQDC